MVAGLKFLGKKSFNPQNVANQRNVWEREQQQAAEARKRKERQEQLKNEQMEEELAKARGSHKLQFMYAVPPGLDTKKSSSNNNNEQAASSDTSTTASHLLQRQPGDDDAAAAFRALLASTNTGTSEDIVETTESSSEHAQTSSFGMILHGATEVPDNAKTEAVMKAPLTELEKAVGRKKTGASLTLDEQIQRFPALANAPRAKGMSSSDIGVTFKPLGSQIRNVKCMACGVWGHSRGDRECRVSGWNPFDSNSGSAAPASARESVNATTESVARPKRSHHDTSSENSSAASSSSSSDDSLRRAKRRRRRKQHKKQKKSRTKDKESRRKR